MIRREVRAASPLPSLTVATAATVIVALGAAAYANSLHGAFVFDDLPSIRDNASIRHLWPLIGPLHPPPEATVTGRPIVNLSLALSYLISGTAPWGHHLVNGVIHLLAGLTLFGLVRQTLLRRDEFKQSATFLAGAAGAIWTVHPLATEAVTYTIQRAESLMGLWYLLTLYCFARARAGWATGSPAGADSTAGARSTAPANEPDSAFGTRWDWFCVSACWLGMATKEVMVSAPCFVLLYDRIFIAPSWRGIWRKRRLLYVALFASWLVLAALVASTHGRGGTAGFGIGVSWWDYVRTQFVAVATYWRLAVWPHPLVFDYGTFWVKHLSDIGWSVAVVAIALGATGWALWRRPAIGFLGLSFFALLAPTSLVPGVSQMIVEHRMYLSTAAVVVGFVMSLRRVPGAVWVFGMVAVSAAALTARRNSDYRSSIALWSDTVAKRPDNRLARNILGAELQLNGRLPEALDEYRAAIRVDPGYSEAQANAGLALLQMKRPAEAIPYFRAALRIDPGMASAHQNLGEGLLAQGAAAEAVAEYRAGMELRPRDPATHNNYANVLLRTGQTSAAVAEYRAALALRADLPDAHYNLANALRRLGQPGAAVAEYQSALKFDPANAQTHNNLANTLTDLNRTAEAIEEYRRALAIDPSYVFAHYNLAAALESSGRKAEAVEEYQAALRLRPELAPAAEALRRLGGG